MERNNQQPICPTLLFKHSYYESSGWNYLLEGEEQNSSLTQQMYKCTFVRSDLSDKNDQIWSAPVESFLRLAQLHDHELLYLLQSELLCQKERLTFTHSWLFGGLSM